MVISSDIINSWIDLNSDLRAGKLKGKYSWFQECPVVVPEMKPKARNTKASTLSKYSVLQIWPSRSTGLLEVRLMKQSHAACQGLNSSFVT